MAERTLRIFVSSPSDVAAERARVKLVADRLNAQLEGVVHLDVLRWEDAFYTAAHSFQQAIDNAVGNMSATDMVLCIVWKRAGLKLNPGIWRRADGSAYESGTVLEFETAVEVSRKHSGVPDVYLFRKSAPVVYEADRVAEQLEQYQLLQSVWKRWTESEEGYNTAGYQSFSEPDDFEVKLEACLRQWLERRGVVAQGPVWDRKLKGSPFRGLAAFEAAHASVFFGREAAIARATAKLRQAPFLLVIGASGSGKSSLLRAGLMPRATAPGVLPDVDLWRTVLVTPSGDPLQAFAEALFADNALAAELKAGDFTTPHLLAELFAASGKAALAPIRTALARAAQLRKETLRYDAPRPAKLMIALDQAERLFVEVEPARVEAFAGLLRGLVEAELASLIAVLRSDTYGRFQTVEPFLALLQSHGATLDLLPPSHAELEDIVTRPVAACHPPLAYETDAQGRSLAEVLVADAKGGDALALLQMTLQRLYDAEAPRGDGVLRFADYPGMDAAVARTAEEAVARLDERALAALPALITAIVRDVTIDPDGGLGALTLVPVVRTEFERGDAARAALIDEFIARRLLTAEEVDGAIRVRPVHEALLRVVPAAVGIIKENAALIRVRHTLDPMVAEWSRAPAEKKSDFLATSPALIAGAAQLGERFGDDLPAGMRAFIAESLAADARRREAERSRQRRILAATAAGLVVAIVLAGLAGWQWRVAAEQKQIADVQRARAQAALTAATEATDKLIFDLAQQFRNRTGMPVDLVRLILERVQELQRQLAQAGERTPELLQLEAVALDELYSVFIAIGDTKSALAAAERSRAILEQLVKAFPTDGRLLRDLAVAINKIGDVRFEISAKWEESLELYRQALAIIERLVTARPNIALWQNDLAICLNKVADMVFHGGQHDEALRTYRRSLGIIEQLAAQEAENQNWQASLAFSHGRIGRVLVALGRHAAALDEYKISVELREKLAAAAPENSGWQNDLYYSLSRLGGVLTTLGRLDEALAAFRRALTIIEKLAATDPGNAQWQRDLAEANENIGELWSTMGRAQQALEALRKSIAIQEKLAAAHPDKLPWQRDLANVYIKLGNVLSSEKDYAAALAVYRQALPIRRNVAAADPGNIRWQRDLVLNHQRIGETLVALGRADEAVSEYRDGLAVIELYAAANLGVASYQIELVNALLQIGLLGDQPRARYERALAILRKLESEGTLPTDYKSWIEGIEELLASLPK